MEPQVSDLLSYKETALEIWQRAEKLYGHKKNYAHIYQIQREIHQAKQQQGQSAMNLFGYLQKKNDEIRIYRPPTTDLTEIQKREEQDEVFQYLASLDPTYEAVRSQILLLAELPSSDEVASMVQGEETRREVMGSQLLKNPEAKGFAAMVKPNPNYRPEVRGDREVERPKWHKKWGDRSTGGNGGYEKRKGLMAAETIRGDEPKEKNEYGPNFNIGALAQHGPNCNRGAPGPNFNSGPNFNNGASPSDPMWQLLMQLTNMMNQKQENTRTSGSDNKRVDW